MGACLSCPESTPSTGAASSADGTTVVCHHGVRPCHVLSIRHMYAKNLQEESETHIWLQEAKKVVCGQESLGFLVYYGTRTQVSKELFKSQTSNLVLCCSFTAPFTNPTLLSLILIQIYSQALEISNIYILKYFVVVDDESIRNNLASDTTSAGRKTRGGFASCDASY